MIEIKDLEFGIKKQRILNGITVNLLSGIHGILGPNGAGKTTLFRCMTGLYTNYTGTINSSETGQETGKKYIGYLPQKFSLIPDLSLYACMDYFCMLKGITKEKKAEIHRCLEIVNMEDYTLRKCRELSGGMIRRAGIAQALLGRPELILFDEPTVGLDPEERIRFRKICKEIDSNTIVLMSTHIVEDILVCCDDVLIMYDGRIIFNGNERELTGRAKEADVGKASPETGYLSVIADARRLYE